MGTHPIFESDFDCLTENLSKFQIMTSKQNVQNWLQNSKQYQNSAKGRSQNRDNVSVVSNISSASGPSTSSNSSIVFSRKSFKGKRAPSSGKSTKSMSKSAEINSNR